jgi:hypothetical protein
MSRAGLKRAIEVGLSRKKFLDRAAAEEYFSDLRTDVLQTVASLQSEYPEERLDGSPESLKSIEKIYFDYLDHQKFDDDRLSKDKFEVLLAFYFCHVFVTNGKANWVVNEDEFVDDSRYYLAIRSINGFITIGCTSHKNHDQKSANKKRQWHYREYKKYAPFCVD